MVGGLLGNDRVVLWDDPALVRWRMRLLGGVLVWLAGAALVTLWLTPAAAGHLVPPDGIEEQSQGTTAETGPEVYRQQCAWCHGPAGEGTLRGPALVDDGAASVDYYLRSGRMPLAQPEAESQRGEPAFGEDTMEALVAYVTGEFGDPAAPDIPADAVAAVEAGEVDLSAGGSAYRLNCASCHNWDGKGGALTAGRNAPSLHDLSPRLIAEAIRVGPGAMPAFDDDVLDDQQLADVTGYVQYLSNPDDAGGWPLAHWGPATEMLAAFAAIGVLVLATVTLGDRAEG